MDELERLRRLLDEVRPTEESKEKTLEAIRNRAQQSSHRQAPMSRLMMRTALVAAVLLAGLIVLRPGAAEAWSPTPVSPQDPTLISAVPDECPDGMVDADQPLLIDQREDVAIALLGELPSAEGPGGFKTCLLAREDSAWLRATNDDLPFELAVTAGTVDERALGEPVSKVVIETDTQLVDVSYGNGFYLIWWPAELALDGEVMRFLASDGSELFDVPVTHEIGTDPLSPGNT